MWTRWRLTRRLLSGAMNLLRVTTAICSIVQMCPHLKCRLREDLPGLRADHLYALLHEYGLLEQPRELVGPAGVPRVQVPPQVLGALLHQGRQHVPSWVCCLGWFDQTLCY